MGMAERRSKKPNLIAIKQENEGKIWPFQKKTVPLHPQMRKHLV
jgi:hypothetical protein